MKTLLKLLPPLTILILIFIIWENYVTLFDISEIILPAPTSIISSFISHYISICQSITITMSGAILGFFTATALAVFTASLFVLSKAVEEALYPLAVAIKATPLISIAPLVNLWLGEGLSSKIFMAALLAYFPILVSTYDGMTRVPQEITDLLKSLDADRFRSFYFVQLPYSLPSLLSSLKIAAPACIVGAVIGEYTGGTSGIGHKIIIESYYLNTDTVFACIFCLAITSMIFFKLVCSIESKLRYW